MLICLLRVCFSALPYRPGKYLAIDCEMVGVGLDGSESSLARVSVVNYYGAVIMDEFVRQKEHVKDWRSHVSGVYPSNMDKGLSCQLDMWLVTDVFVIF